MLSAWAFLTVLGPARPPGRATLRWFPLVGAVLGALLAVVWLGAEELWPPAVAAVVVLAVDLALTGMLHVDGLADSADGLLPHLDRERRLAVMRGPEIGAFALAVVPTTLLARWAALATDQVDPVALVAVWSAGRTLAATAPAVLPYAREDGLATAFLSGATRWIALWWLPAGGLLLWTHSFRGAISLVAALALGSGAVLLARRRVGGFTGDVLGAAVIVTETAALVGLAGS